MYLTLRRVQSETGCTRGCEDKAAIERELGIPVQWASDGRKHTVSSSEPGFRGQLIEDHGPKVRAMMADRVNRFVNVFRPRLERMVRVIM